MEILGSCQMVTCLVLFFQFFHVSVRWSENIRPHHLFILMIKQMAMVDIPRELNQSILGCETEIRILTDTFIVTCLCPSDSYDNNCKPICMKVVSPSFVILPDIACRIGTYVFIDIIFRAFIILAVDSHVFFSDDGLKHIQTRNFSHICLNKVIFKTIVTHKISQFIVLLWCNIVQEVTHLAIGEIIESRILRILIEIQLIIGTVLSCQFKGVFLYDLEVYQMKVYRMCLRISTNEVPILNGPYLGGISLALAHHVALYPIPQARWTTEQNSHSIHDDLRLRNCGKVSEGHFQGFCVDRSRVFIASLDSIQDKIMLKNVLMQTLLVNHQKDVVEVSRHSILLTESDQKINSF